MLREGRTAGHDLGEVLCELFSSGAIDQLVEVRIAVKVIEVFEQPELERLTDVGIGLVARQPSGQVDRYLFVADGRLERRLIAGTQPVDGLLLLGLDATGP